jgi:hypothetical protein
MIGVECGVKKEHFHTKFLGVKKMNYNFRKISGPRGDSMTFFGKFLIFGRSNNMAGAPELRTLRWTGYMVRMRTDFRRGKLLDSEQLQESGRGRRIILRWIAWKQVMVMEGRLNRAGVLAAFNLPYLLPDVELIS